MSIIYVPIIKWKKGEYSALAKLSPEIKKHVLPLIEITPIEWDFQENKEAKTIEEHLKNMPKHYQKKWGKRPAYIDTYLLGNTTFTDGSDPLEFIYDKLSKEDIKPTPVTRITRSQDFQKSLKKLISAHDLDNLCIRITLEDSLEENLAQRIKDLISYFGMQEEECDLVFDLGSPNFSDIESLAAVVWGQIKELPLYLTARNLAVTASSFPETMGGIKAPGQTIIPREEWNLYKEIVAQALAGDRLPNFGDYSISHPSYNTLDMRLIKPIASIKYTTDDGWLIIRGTQTRVPKGFVQFHKLSEAITEAQGFLGSAFSEGDKYIEECSKRSDKPGNLTTWVEVGNNHHFTKVVNDLISNAHAA